MVSISEVLVQLAHETQSIGILLGWGFWCYTPIPQI